MTVQAYLIKDISSKTKDNEITIEKIIEKTPTFNLNNHENILKLFQSNECDNTNKDLNGELTIDKITWKEILTNLSTEKYTPEELNIIDKITKDLKNKEIIFYECF
ncbi:hypothetical protein [Methanobrevibacter sp.]|uniref:hypothetical protein n=1 Tax=Methanobrevibacter sp. TaxID=66852 RepID=UPI0026E0FA23|nr:hypothetical protein [Methanobrevibacter sp.]MDO5859573.1 hypothetical protein [Methanobrevibacter sp.]